MRDAQVLFALVIGLVLWSLPLRAGAATLHVSPDGDDANPGTAEQPFRTIQKAADTVAAGDTVRIHAGTYTETVVMKTSGEADRQIVFEGERAADGEWLTTLDLGVPIDGWEPAPEVAEGVFKTTKLGFIPYSMTLDGKQIARVHDRTMATGTGFGLLALPADAPPHEPYAYYTEDQGFWDGVEVLYGAQEGTTWIRFRNGDDPTDKNLRGAPAGGGIEMREIAHVTVRDLRICNAQDCVVIAGEGAHHNVVERCFLTNGHNRVVITEGASHNIVRENEMTLGYYGHDDPGAWGRTPPNRQDSLRCHVYRVFKIIVGPGGSDDHGAYIRRAGTGNEVSHNHIYNGLIGVSVGESRDTDVHHNVIHNMSSIGVLTSEDAQKGAVDLRCHDNLIYDCNINIRLHHYNNCLPGERREYHYRNLMWLPEGLATHIYVHWTSKEMVAGCGHPELYIYHNSFSGGRYGFSPSGWAADDGGLKGAWLINNLVCSQMAFAGSLPLMSDETMMGPVDYNWAGGGFNHHVPPWAGEHNVVADPGSIWPFGLMPDFTIAEDSPVRGIGLDLSRAFTIMGRSHDALPGMEPGYFAGDAPDLGALQFGQTAPVELPQHLMQGE